jgi:transposase
MPRRPTPPPAPPPGGPPPDLAALVPHLTQQLIAQQRQIDKLLKMVEGLTQQLSAALDARAAQERAALAAKAEEARAAAEAAARTAAMAAAAAAALPAPEPTEPQESASTRAFEPTPSPPPKPHGGGVRRPRPTHIELDVVHVAPTACPCGSAELRALDEEHIEQVDYVRAHIRVQRIVRMVCRCAACGDRVMAPAPPMPFDRATCTMRFIGWLVFAKLGLFLPLDRVRRDFIDQGADLPSSTLTRWLQRGLELLAPLAQVVRASLLQQSHIQCDGTGLLIVFQGPRDGPRTAHGQVLFFGDPQHAVFQTTPDKSGAHVDQFLNLAPPGAPPRLWSGTLIADASSVFDHLFLDGDRVEAGCNAHSLRAFRDEADKAPLLASRALGFIRGFYRVEDEARAKKLRGDALLAYRRAHAGPIAAQFEAWLKAHLEDLLPSPPVRKAMQVRLNHWAALVRFLDDPQVPLDNNFSERELRKVALLRNNSLSAGRRRERAGPLRRADADPDLPAAGREPLRLPRLGAGARGPAPRQQRLQGPRPRARGLQGPAAARGWAVRRGLKRGRAWAGG